MAWRLERNEVVADGFRRIAAEEMAAAISSLTAAADPLARDTGVHDARKNIKRVRAILRLMRSEMGDVARRENVRLRSTALRLSELRDAAAVIETFDYLTEHYKDELGPSAIRSLRAALVAARETTAQKTHEADLLVSASAALRKVQTRSGKWPLAEAGFAALAPGLEQAHRAARKALARAIAEPSAERFHELRKRVKDQWYQTRLLEGLWNAELRTLEKRLKDLETWLGEDHNLTVLEGLIDAEAIPAKFARAKDRARVLSVIFLCHNDLRGKALVLAGRLYAVKPVEFTRRLALLWDQWQAR